MISACNLAIVTVILVVVWQMKLFRVAYRITLYQGYPNRKQIVGSSDNHLAVLTPNPSLANEGERKTTAHKT